MSDTLIPDAIGEDTPKHVNMFDDIDPEMHEARAEKNEHVNMFDEFPDPEPTKVSGFTSFLSRAAGGALPAVGGMVAAGAGAQAGAGLGAGIGALGGPLAWATVPAGAAIGGFIGGLGGFFAGSAATEGVQDWAIHQAPDNWQEALGQSDRQKRLQEEQHPYYSLMGGLVPYVVTMAPGKFTTKALNLPENATAFQKIMANPVTSRAFGGAAMGGMELGQEAWQGETPDWAKVGISTGFGLVFNKPTQFGEYLHGVGARSANVFRIRPMAPGAELLNPEEPTVAQGADVGVVGPGITESTFQGGEQQSPATRITAHNAAADEEALLGSPSAGPDLETIARRLDPATFQRNDQLVAQRDALREWIRDQSNPTDTMLDELAGRRYAAEEALRNANPNGPAARGFRAELTDIAAQERDLAARRQAWQAGAHVDTPDIALARQHLQDTEHALWDLAPEISAARRRAADHVGQFEPEPEETPVSPVEALTAPVPETPTAPLETPTEKSIEAQRAFITQDRTAQLTAVGLSRQVAEASAHVEAAYYETLAARFNGALGTAEDLYRQRAARVVGPGGAAPTTPPAPITRTAPTPTVIRTVADIQAQEKVSAARAKQIQEQEILARATSAQPVTPAPAPAAPRAEVTVPPVQTGAEVTPEPAPPVVDPNQRPRLRTGADIAKEDGIRDPKAIKAVQDQELLALADWQAQQRATASPPPSRNPELTRLARDTGVGTTRAEAETALAQGPLVAPLTGLTGAEPRSQAEIIAEIVDRLPPERVIEEANAQAEAGAIEYREAEQAAADVTPEVHENPDQFYGADQARSLEELESEHRPPNQAVTAEQRPVGGGEPVPAETGARPIPEGSGPPEPVSGVGGRVEPAGGEPGGEGIAPAPAVAGEPVVAPGAAEGGEQGLAAGAEPAGVRPVDGRGNPIFRQGERVVIADGEDLAGRHGTVSEANALRVRSLGSGGEETTYHYKVITDGGASTYPRKLTPETGERPTVIPDITYHGSRYDPASMQRVIDQYEEKAQRADRTAARARGEKGRAAARGEAKTERLLGASAKKALDAWVVEHPEAAKNIPGYKAPEPAADTIPTNDITPTNTDTAPAIGNRAGMSLVETRHTKTGEPLFVVTGGPRVDATEFASMKVEAKGQGGYWSSFRGNGAVPGWTFKTRAGAEAFMRGGDANSAVETANLPSADLPQISPTTNGWTILGKNAQGEDVFEDARGIRSVMREGMRHTESVQLRPTRTGMDIERPSNTTRGERWKVVPEAAEVAPTPGEVTQQAGQETPEPQSPVLQIARRVDDGQISTASALRSIAATMARGDAKEYDVRVALDRLGVRPDDPAWKAALQLFPAARNVADAIAPAEGKGPLPVTSAPKEPARPIEAPKAEEPDAVLDDLANMLRPQTPEQREATRIADQERAERVARQMAEAAALRAEPPREPGTERPADYGANNKLVTRDDAEAIRARLRAKAAQLRTGIDPEMMLDGARLAVFHIEAGARSFAAYAHEMLTDIGDEFRPYLRSWYESARHWPGNDARGMSSAAEIDHELDRLQQAQEQLDKIAGPKPITAEDKANVMHLVEDDRGRDDLEPEAHDVADMLAHGWTPAEISEAPGINLSEHEVRALAEVLEDRGLIPEVEAEDGVQGALFVRDEGARPEDVSGVAPVGENEPAPPGEEHGGTPATGRNVGEQAEGQARTLQPGGPEGGRGDRAEPTDRVSAPGERSEPGATGRFADRPDRLVKGENFSIEPGDLAEGRGRVAKARDNLAAVELTKRLLAEGRPATKAEQAILVKYVGWGGLKGAFEGSDGKFGKGFEDLGARLKAALTETEYRTAAQSTQYAHYTAEHVVRSMWDAVRRMGFTGGSVFEPGMGIGHFLGIMPADLAKKSQYEGIERDHLTAQIASLLYPESGVRQADYIRTPMPEKAFDLVIGNPPFSDTVISADPKYAARKFMLHDYFFAKSLDSVRPGGLLAFVTSAGTMNKMDSSAREYLAERAEFVGGVRLNSSAFRRNANTEVTTDVLFFKRHEGDGIDLSGEKPAWTDSVKRVLPSPKFGDTEANVSRYFTEHPENVLGREIWGEGQATGAYEVQAEPGTDLAADLQAAILRLPENVMTEPPSPEQRAALDFESGQKKDGSFYLGEDGRLMQYRDGAGREVPARGNGSGGFTAGERERIQHLVPIRDALREVFAADLARDDAAGAEARGRMNEHYDRFVEKFGPINQGEFTYRKPTLRQIEEARLEAREEARSINGYWDDGDFDPSEMLANKATVKQIADARQAAREAAEAAGRKFNEGSFNPSDVEDTVTEKRPNIRPFRSDPESYRLRSIEDYNDFTGQATKKKIFYESILKFEEEPEINSANDGVLWSMNKLGRFDVDAIAEKMGKEKGDIIAELGDSVYKVPGTQDTYQTKDEYLSGDIVSKLETARAEAENDPDVRRNIVALEGAAPPPLPPSEIDMVIGMPWIPSETVRAFVRDHLEMGEPAIFHSDLTGTWHVNGEAFAGTTGAQRWGTESRGAFELLSDAMNRTPPKIYNWEGSGKDRKRVFDEVATQAAQDKVNEIKTAFADWAKSNTEQADGLAQVYNDALNRSVLRQYDGSYMTTSGVASTWSWRPHQTRVVSRIVQDGNTYMAHAVGAGKTSAMIGAGMEMKRLGLVKKPLYVVPNHMLGQFTKEFYEQYPTARISVADEERFHTDRRRQFVANVAQDDLDAVIMTHSSFGKLAVSDEFQRHLIDEQLEMLEEALSEIPPDDRITRGRLENQKEKLEQKLSKSGQPDQDQTLTFEELGTDFLFVDEAHQFRKLSFATKQSGMKGISPEGSNMAWDLYSKVRYLDSQKPGRSVVFASGTPITNTMGELYSLSRFMQPEALAKRGLSHFDSWAQTFGDTKTGLEETAAGTYNAVTRFGQFVNLPELYKMVGEVMDIVTPSQLEQYVTRPKLRGGEREFHLAPRTEILDQYQAELGRRMEAIKARKGPPKKGDDILLSVINDGRHAAIDPRFVEETQSDPHSKLNMLIENVARIYHDTGDKQFFDPESNYEKDSFKGPATQMIFANLGVNGRGPMGFSSYQAIKEGLRRAGVDPSHIAFIGDYGNALQRQNLFNDMNEGKIRVLVGSTQKMGTGVNAQRRLYALHNLDPLWFPADDEQRVGRILRQGNHNPEIEVHDYSTKGTYDSAMWKMMGNKGRFIEQFFRGDPNLRNMEDIGEASMYEQASAMATTDERIITLTQMKQDLDKARRQESAHDREQYALRQKLRQHGSDAQMYQRLADGYREDIARREDTSGDKFKMVVAGETLDKRADANKALAQVTADRADGLGKDASTQVGQIGGFPLIMRRSSRGDLSFQLRLSGGNTREVNFTWWGSKSAHEAYVAEVSKQGEEGLAKAAGSMQGAHGLVASAEHVLRTFEERAANYDRVVAQNLQAAENIRSLIGKEFTGGPEIARLRNAVNDLEGQLKREAEGAKNPGGPTETPADELYQRVRTTIQGRIRIAPGDVRSVITMARTHDASTFMHETSHDWLKQLLMDAGHELAPDQLRQDATTVREWLKRPEGWTGFKRDGSPDVVPQERFARGFEQYLREGHAPSRALDGVFAQFKSWLTTIYRTLRGLGAPINDDIRGVFDRMLAIEPKRRTFGETPERQHTLGGIHDTDAAETHPHEAEQVADRIAAERNKVVAAPPPEIAHEVAAAGGEPGATDTTGQTGVGTAGTPEVPGTGGEPQSVTGGGGVGQGYGTERGGGGEAPAEGPGAPTGRTTGDNGPNATNGRRGAGANPGPEQLAPQPPESFADTEPKLVDLAGNIRVENLTDVQSVAEAIHDSAARNDEFSAVRGGMTKGQMLDLAESMGLDPSKIDETTLGRMFGGTQDLGPKILAARRLVVQSAEIVSGLMKTAGESGLDRDVAAMGVAIARHDMIQSFLAGVTAEWGRAGNAFHSLLTGWEKAQDLNQLLKENLGRDLYQLRVIAKMGARLDSPGKVSKYLRDAKQRSFGGMILEYWINGLISGPATHATYSIGNTLLAINKAAPETATAAAIGAIRSRFGREGTRVRLGEVGAQLRGAIREAPAAAQAGIEAMRTGATTMLPGEKTTPYMPFQDDAFTTSTRSMTNAPVTWHEVAGDAYGLVQGMRDGLVTTGELIKAGGTPGAPMVGAAWSPLGQIPDITFRGATVVPLGTVARLPGRAIAVIHSMFRSMNYSMEINALAYRQAAEEGHVGTAFAARVADLRQNPSEEMMNLARTKATDMTLMGQGGNFVNRLSQLTNATVNLPLLGATAPLKFVDPFVHIAGNIMNQALLQRTPIGLLAREIRADLSGANGNIAQDTAMAKMLVGSALAMTFGGLAAQGLASGSGPADPRKAAMWRLAGNQAHSIRIGDFWYDAHRLGPLGMIGSIATDLYDVAHQIGREDADVIGKSIMHAFTQNILDESFMRGPSDLIKAVTDPDRYGAGYVRTFLSSFTPYSVGMSQTARAMDPYSRQARTIMDAIRAKIPGMSESLWVRRDIWGEPMPNPDAFIAPGITAIYERQMSHDPVNMAMLDLGIGPAPVERQIRNVKLTDEQYDEFARIAGRSVKMRLDAIVRSPDYQSWPTATRFGVIQETFKQSREAARGMMMMKYPEIPREAAKLQIARKTGQPVH